MQDFKDELVAFSKVAVTRSERVTSEEAAKQYLILPFFQLLGYDPLDPDEIIPEAQASFSDKFKNKVDYAICIDREPVMGVNASGPGNWQPPTRAKSEAISTLFPQSSSAYLQMALSMDSIRIQTPKT